MEEKLIAPCGINCAVCSAYLAYKHDLKSKGMRKTVCAGCRPEGRQCSLMKKECGFKGRYEYCYECDDFPCRGIKRLEKRYSTNYRMSPVENLEYIRDRGMDSFLKKEEEKWKCPDCGDTICCHNGICYNCGLDKLKAELQHLTAVERPAIQRAIAEAREHGDLRENAEYHAAKERQGFIEGRIQEIQGKLANAQVIDTSNFSNEKVVFGATVVLLDMDTEEEKRYTLVGTDESDLKEGKISVLSPVGKALISHAVGDVVSVRVPAGTVDYEVLEIFFEN